MGYNTIIVMASCAVLGFGSGILGPFIVYRRKSLMADAFAHATLPGVVTSFLLGYLILGQGKILGLLLLGACIFVLLAGLAIEWIVKWVRLPADAAIAIVLSVFFGIGVALISVIQAYSLPEAGGINRFIYGHTAGMSINDAYIMTVLVACALVLVFLFMKELKIICFDEEFAKTQGIRVGIIDLLLVLLLAIITVAGIQAVGLIMIVAIVVIPPSIASLWSASLNKVIVISGISGSISGVIGSYMSSIYDNSPTGALIVLVLGFLFFLSAVVSPARGIIIRGLIKQWQRAEIVIDHILRKYLENKETCDLGTIAKTAGLSKVDFWFVVSLMKAKGLVKRKMESYQLTEAGFDRAQEILRKHQLIEDLMLQKTETNRLSPHFEADMAEHVIDERDLRELQQLKEHTDDK